VSRTNNAAGSLERLLADTSAEALEARSAIARDVAFAACATLLARDVPAELARRLQERRRSGEFAQHVDTIAGVQDGKAAVPLVDLAAAVAVEVMQELRAVLEARVEAFKARALTAEGRAVALEEHRARLAAVLNPEAVSPSPTTAAHEAEASPPAAPGASSALSGVAHAAPGTDDARPDGAR
jgi:hypothetical protein